MRITEDARVSRDVFVKGLADRGVGAGIYYPKLVFDYDAYRNHPRVNVSDVPVASKIVNEVLSLPVHTYLIDSELSEIIAAVRAVAGA